MKTKDENQTFMFMAGLVVGVLLYHFALWMGGA